MKLELNISPEFAAIYERLVSLPRFCDSDHEHVYRTLQAEVLLTAFAYLGNHVSVPDRALCAVTSAHRFVRETAMEAGVRFGWFAKHEHGWQRGGTPAPWFKAA
jgi:hypothetical protein